MDSSHILAPSFLFGTYDSTQSGWKSFAERLWTSRSWVVAMEGVDVRPVLRESGPVIVWNSDRRMESTCEALPFRSRKALWQFNWILEAHLADSITLAFHARTHWDLLCDGINRFEWMALGVLQGDPSGIPLLREALYPSSEEYDREGAIALFRTFAGHVVKHLRSLSYLNDRIAIASGRKGRGVTVVGLARRLGLLGDMFARAGRVHSQEFSALMRGDPDQVIARCEEICEKWTDE